jgi:hypothetical protein
MNRIPMLTLLAALAVAGTAFAQSSTTEGRAAAGSSGAGAMNAGAQAAAEADAQASTEALRKRIVERAAKVSSAALEKTERQLDAVARRVDQTANAAEQKVADRLAKEFGVTAEALAEQQSEVKASWGQLMIAHTIEANSTSGATAEQLLELHAQGMGWGSIAAGLGLTLGEVVSAANAEQRVATGAARADGRVAVVHGEGARAGMGGTVNAGLGAKGLGVNANGGVNTGLKIGH